MPTNYCNMNCVYCFNSKRKCKEHITISQEMIQKIFSTTIPYYKKVKFIWHGGEPTSVGVDFYRNVVDMQKMINKYNTVIENSIQTNLTLLDLEFVTFLLNNNFHIGSSFDGVKNELTRHNSEKILAGRELVIENGGKVGFICVVQSKNVDHLIDDYEWFKKKKINYTLNMYISKQSDNSDPLYVSPYKYAYSICELFDHWVNDIDCNINISLFEEYIDYFLFGEKHLCCYNSCLGKHIGIQPDGFIFNCNREFSMEYCYGNIMDYTDIHECFESEGFLRSVDKAYIRREYCKDNCPIFGFCAGGCNHCADIGGDYSKTNDNICIITRIIYEHIEKRMKELITGDLKNLKINRRVYNKLIQL